jgi:hypothetical protein
LIPISLAAVYYSLAAAWDCFFAVGFFAHLVTSAMEIIFYALVEPLIASARPGMRHSVWLCR